MKYISHLDLLRLFGRALRRGNLPFATTGGFNRRPKIVIKRALKLGIESENEEASISFREAISAEDFKQRFQKQLPEGIVIKEAALDLGPGPN